MRKYQKGVIFLPIIIVVLLLGVGYFAYQRFQLKNNESIVPPEQIPLETKSTPTPQPTSSQQQTSSNTTPLETECGEFPDMLETCTKHTCRFTHPLTGEEMTREIVGIVNGNCSYTEKMPNNGQMDCKYTEEMRKAVAQYHRNLASAESFGTEASVDLGSEEVEVTYTINGKSVSNPLQEALTTGECIVSGY